MVGCVKALATMPYGLSLISRTHKGERADYYRLSSDCHTHAMTSMCTHRYTHTQSINDDFYFITKAHKQMTFSQFSKFNFQHSYRQESLKLPPT